MENIKLLLYCCKQPHKLFNTDKGFVLSDFELGDAYKDKTLLNGKIVAECNYEVEEIEHYIHQEPEVDVGVAILPGFECDAYHTNTLGHFQLLEKSCLDEIELDSYLKGKNGKAIYIKNLKERVMELSDCHKKYEGENYSPTYYMPITNAPQNMCRVWIYEDGKWVMYILISVRPEWLFLELNGEKTVELRKNVLKEML